MGGQAMRPVRSTSVDERRTPEVPVRRGIVFGVVSVALLMSSIDQTIVATALHALQEGLHSSISVTGWVITVYAIGQVLALPLAGDLCDRFGRRAVLLTSIILFTVASLCCGLATNMYLLLVFRAVQAVGGAGVTPAATGIVVDHFGAARDKAVALFSSVMPLGTVVGPVLGGVIIDAWSWRGAFLINVPIGVCLIVLAVKFVPADRPSGTRGRMDGTGMLLLGAGAILSMSAISVLGHTGARMISAEFLVPMLAGLCSLGAFVRHIGRAKHPFLAPHLLHGNSFGALNVINFLCGAATSGIGALIPLYAIDRYGISTLGSGTLLTGRGIAMVCLSALAVLLLRRTGYRIPLFVGFALTGLGMLGIAVAPIGMSAYWWLAGAATVTGIGLGWSNPATRNASLQLAPNQAPAIAAVRSMGRRTGSIVSISIATAIIGHSGNPGLAETWVFGIFGLVLLIAIPLACWVPEHRGAW